MKVYIGQAKLVGPISRYAGKFNFLELGAEPGRCPRPAVLKQWRKDVPKGFEFAVRLARAVGAFDAGAEQALTLGLRAAEALEARWLVVQTPATLGPGQRNRDRLKKLFERLLETGRHVAWDPRGVWDEAEILPLISEVDVQWARDASRYEMVEEPLAYVRIPALGTASRIGLGLAERAGENLRGFEEVYVVIEGEGAGRAAKVIRDMIRMSEETDETIDDGVEELSMDSATGARMFEGAKAAYSAEESAEEDDELEDDELEDDELEDDELEDDELEDNELEDDEFEDDDRPPKAGKATQDDRNPLAMADDDLEETDEEAEEDPELTKPDVIDDSDLPWAPRKRDQKK